MDENRENALVSLLCLGTISDTESNARYRRYDQIKSNEACFGPESFVDGLKYKSMTLCSSGVQDHDQLSVQLRADCCDCEVSGPSTTCA